MDHSIMTMIIELRMIEDLVVIVSLIFALSHSPNSQNVGAPGKTQPPAIAGWADAAFSPSAPHLSSP